MLSFVLAISKVCITNSSFPHNKLLWRLLVDNPANILTSDQRCFNLVDQCWNNVDPTLKMKQNPTSDFQRSATLIQRQSPKLKQRWNNVTQRRSNVGTKLIQRCFNLASTLVKTILNPVGLVVMIMNLQIQEWFLFF